MADNQTEHIYRGEKIAGAIQLRCARISISSDMPRSSDTLCPGRASLPLPKPAQRVSLPQPAGKRKDLVALNLRAKTSTLTQARPGNQSYLTPSKARGGLHAVHYVTLLSKAKDPPSPEHQRIQELPTNDKHGQRTVI